MLDSQSQVSEPVGTGTVACKLTIGMPVYNGERYIGRAIESILAQSFRDFRLVVLDNASTDGTAAIVQQFVERDARVHYRRNQRNIGAGGNFNRVFGFCDTPYFKWAACDDELEPSYLARCMAALEDDPSVVLAHSFVRQIDAGSRPSPVAAPCAGEYVEPIDDARAPGSVYRPAPPEVEGADRLTRFRFCVLCRVWCTEIFGVIRASALAETPLIANFAGSDRTLLAELALRGRFSLYPAPLFLNRDHSGRFTRRVFLPAQGAVGRDQMRTWYDTSRPPQRYQMDWWMLYAAYFDMIRRNIASPLERLAYYRPVLGWLSVRCNRSELIKDLLYRINPRMLQWLVGQRYRLRRAR